ncbi:MAG: hypothetical protein JO190_06980 [Candidatus Eremiobacteraeota bacterium]|nr:hypothetical protein [Candidatus Eremiobacteraeota bacterium]MBV8499054.1 hypothetical protein [Candidatus Eremiobacteraeota bacterium]
MRILRSIHLGLIFAAATLLAACAQNNGVLPRSNASAGTNVFSPEQVLYRFLGGTDGSHPFDGLLDIAGDFYGTTQGAGSGGTGTVFKLSPSIRGYSETIVYAFRGGGMDGSGPLGSLIADKSGALYGLTFGGGPAYNGTAFKLTPSGGAYSESVIYFFRGGTDGSNPNGALTNDAAGNLYGTTTAGGANGAGTVFRLTPAGSGYSEEVLYSFKGGTDGTTPRAGLLAVGSNLLYGTTLNGGGTSCNFSGTTGCGTIFRLKLKGGHYVESIAYRFQGGSDGANPYGDLIADPTGAIYGTTGRGGNTGSACGSSGCGTVFKLTPAGRRFSESIIYRFKGGSDGLGPVAGLIRGSNGAFYGTTLLGGTTNAGTVFVLTPAKSDTYMEKVLYTFGSSGATDGAGPSGDLIFGSGGDLYSTTSTGGTSGNGTVFDVMP